MTGAVQKLFTRLPVDERRLTVVEYAVLGVIVVGAIVAVGKKFLNGHTTALGKILAGTA